VKTFKAMDFEKALKDCFPEQITLHDEHVYSYRHHLPMIRQWKACDKVWDAYGKGKMNLDQAIEAWFRTIK
jgi:hypothetical protein